MHLLTRLKLRARITAAFALVILIGLGVASYAAIQSESVAQQVGTMSMLSGNVVRVLGASRSLSDIHTGEIRYRLLNGEDAVKFVNEHIAETGKLLSDAAQATRAEDRRRVYDNLQRSLQAHKATFGVVVGLNQTAEQARVKLTANAEPLSAASTKLVDLAQKSDSIDRAYAENVNEAVLRVRFASARFLASDEADKLSAFKKSVDAADAALAATSLTGNANIAEVKARLADYTASLETFSAARTQLNVLSDTALRPQILGMQTELKNVSESITSAFEAARTSSGSMLARTASIEEILAVAGLVTGSLLAFFTGRLIANPIIAITGAMRRLAQNDLTVAIPGLKRHDEIGSMATAVGVFRDNAVAVRQMEEEQAAAQQRRAVEDERVRVEAEQAAAAEAASIVVGSIGAGLAHLASGDLTFRLETVLPPPYEKLRVDLNHAMDRLQDVIQRITANTSALRSGTGEITSAADDLSRRTEQQAASLEETAAALDEITATVRKTAEGAQHAQDVVAKTRIDADKSGVIVKQAVAAMDSIAQSSNQITQIIGVIDEIAFQTNLLALNAGVEAARAGDAGRGFAVVASEVRSLAQRSAEAAKEIKGLISTSAQHVGSGVKLVGDTGEALARIVSQVNQITSVMSEIAVSAQEQATGLGQVNTAVNQMDQMTQQNAAMVEQSTAASHALAHETEELAKLAATFQIVQAAPEPAPSARGATPASSRQKQTDRRPAVPASPQPKQPDAAKRQPTKGGPPPKVVRQAKPTGSSSPALAVAADSWEEF